MDRGGEPAGRGAVSSEAHKARAACLRHTGALAPVIASLKTMNTDKSMVVQLQSCLHFPSLYMAIKALRGPNVVGKGRR